MVPNRDHEIQAFNRTVVAVKMAAPPIVTPFYKEQHGVSTATIR